MLTLISILDVIVLLLFIAHIPRTVTTPARGTGSGALAVVIAIAVVIFASVSFAANAELIAHVSGFYRLLVLLSLLVMAGLVGATWVGKEAA